MNEEKMTVKTAEGETSGYGKWMLAVYVIAVLVAIYYMDSIVSKLGFITRLKH